MAFPSYAALCYSLLHVILLLSSTLLLGIRAALRLFDGYAGGGGTAGGGVGDPCGEYATCAACVSARYYGRRFVAGSDGGGGGGVDGEVEGLVALNDGKGREPADPSTGPAAASAEEPFVGFWPFDMRPSCRWNPSTSACSLAPPFAPTGSGGSGSGGDYIYSQYSCPLYPTPYPPDSDPPDPFLSDWMGSLLDRTDGGAFGELPLLDLSLPGTHDSMSYDLSATVSDEASDGERVRELIEFLHFVSGGTLRLMPGEIEDFLRLQAQTQHLTVTQQLDNGARFLDFRVGMDRTAGVWRCLHFLQSVHPTVHYLRLIREWLDMHPREVVVLWMSREGNTGATGEDQFPGVSVEEKREFWADVETIFDGVLSDARISDIGRTSLADMVDRNHRLVVFASDWAEFTDSSPYAVDAANMDNFWVNDVFDLPNTLPRQRSYFRDAAERNAEIRRRGNGTGFTLMGMNTPGQGWQLEGAARERFLPRLWNRLPFLRNDCAARVGRAIPGSAGTWCPETLLDVTQLTSYYDQIPLEEAYRSSGPASADGDGGGSAFPNAFYLDALDRGGTIRTGAVPLFGSARGGDDGIVNGTSGYSFADTVIAYNARRACGGRENGKGGGPQSSPARLRTEDLGSTSDRRTSEERERRFRSRSRGGSYAADGGGCEELLADMERRRARHPIKLWSDPAFGRRDDWPK